tara:strand:+ start:5251 stop:6534 length:1284 start_codon:yes stop_codon:yes gene_type:complete
MKFKSAFILTNIHIIIKVTAGIIMNKVISVYLGPSGLALLGQFQNTTGLITSIGHGSIQTGLVKYISSEKNNENNFRKIISTSLGIILGLTLIVSIVTFIFSENLSQFVFFSKDYNFIFYLFSFSILFYSLNIYLLSITNGFEKIKLFTTINILLSLVTLITASILTIYFKLSGALISIVLSQFIVFIISFFLIKNKFKINLFDFPSIKNNFDKVVSGKLFKFSIATFSSGAIVALTMIIIRNIIINEISIQSAGVWESGWKILVYFNMIFAVPFSIYYFPKFSKSINIFEIKLMLFDSLKLTLPLMILLSLIIILLKDYIITILFSDDFLSLGQFLNYIIIAEIFRIIGIFIQNTYLSQTKVFTTIFFQLLFFGTFILFSYNSIENFGLIGVGISYLISSVVFLISYLIYFYFRNPLKSFKINFNE